MHDLIGKVALVTGGGGGIGSAIAAELAENGALVAVADVDIARARLHAGRLKGAHAFRLDVTQRESWLAVLEEIEQSLGPIDIFCSNAAVNAPGLPSVVEVDLWRWLFDVNVTGALLGVQALLPGMRARGTPCHILITCSVTSLLPIAAHAAYAASKAALLSLAECLRQELLGSAIGVTALCPGTVATNMAANSANAQPRGKASATPAAAAAIGMDPASVAKTAVTAIRQNLFHAFTHAEYAEFISARHDVLMSAMADCGASDHRDPERVLAMFSESVRDRE